MAHEEAMQAMTYEEAMQAGVPHILGQRCWHSPAFIVGDRRALQRLIAHLTTALETGAAETEFFPHDGEGFGLHTRCLEPEEMAAVPLGYTDHEVCGPSGPWPEWMRHAE